MRPRPIVTVRREQRVLTGLEHGGSNLSVMKNISVLSLAIGIVAAIAHPVFAGLVCSATDPCKVCSVSAPGRRDTVVVPNDWRANDCLKFALWEKGTNTFGGGWKWQLGCMDPQLKWGAAQGGTRPGSTVFPNRNTCNWNF